MVLIQIPDNSSMPAFGLSRGAVRVSERLAKISRTMSLPLTTANTASKQPKYRETTISPARYWCSDLIDSIDFFVVRHSHIDRKTPTLARLVGLLVQQFISQKESPSAFEARGEKIGEMATTRASRDGVGHVATWRSYGVALVLDVWAARLSVKVLSSYRNYLILRLCDAGERMLFSDLFYAEGAFGATIWTGD